MTFIINPYVFATVPATTSIWTDFLNAYDGSTQIGSYSTGVMMPDWTRAVGSGAPASNQVVSMAGTVAGRAFRMVGSTGINQTAYFTWNYVGTHQDAEILMSMYIENVYAAPTNIGGPRQRFVSVSGALGTAASIINGSCPTVGTANGGKSYAADTWYWVRFRTNGTTVQGKFWQRGTSEPSSWDATATISTSTTGAAGLAFNYRSDIEWRTDFFSISTDGTTAYGPV